MRWWQGSWHSGVVVSIKPACMPTWDTVDAKVDADVIEARTSYGVTV